MSPKTQEQHEGTKLLFVAMFCPRVRLTRNTILHKRSLGKYTWLVKVAERIQRMTAAEGIQRSWVCL